VPPGDLHDEDRGATGYVAGPLAFEAFYADEFDRVYRALAVALGDHQVAREATDEAMARAYARWRTVGRYDKPGGWAYRVGLNWARSRWRKRRREDLGIVDDDASATTTVAGPEPAGGQATAALQRLPLKQRSVVVCRILLDLDTADTAVALGIPLGTAKSRLARGLTTLRNELQEDDR
jgi:RNA polymerase sigma-70 factor (ECF subfamily)